MVRSNRSQRELKKLLYITTNIAGSGGVSKVLSVKLNYLVKHYGFDVSVLNTHGSENTPFYAFDEAIRFYHLKRRGLFKGYFGYRKELNHLIEKIAPDIIINADNGLKGAMLPFYYKGNIPLIFESHNSKNVKANSLFGNVKIKLQNFMFSRFVDKYKAIVVYEHAKNDWIGNNIMVIPNPLGLKRQSVETTSKNNIVIAVGADLLSKRL